MTVLYRTVHPTHFATNERTTTEYAADDRKRKCLNGVSLKKAAKAQAILTLACSLITARIAEDYDTVVFIVRRYCASNVSDVFGFNSAAHIPENYFKRQLTYVLTYLLSSAIVVLVLFVRNERIRGAR